MSFDPAQWVVDTPERFRVHRDIFREPDIFDLEMRHIFESTWVFLGFACQVPRPHDFFTTSIGRSPVIVSRDAQGRLGAFLNSCRHRGALVCHDEQGHSKFHVCHYHGWAYDSAGRAIDIKDEAHGCYPAQFGQEDHGLKCIAHFGEYRGFLFGSLNPDVKPLEEHLGDTRVFIDMVVDQGEAGFELVPGYSSYIFNGNWKLQVENCVDLYHLTSTHPSFMQIVERRKSGDSGNGLAAIDFADYRLPGMVRGSYTFANGHAMVWGGTAAPQVRPLWDDIERVRARVGPLRAQWMLATRNLTLYPNMQIAENASLQVRVIRPLAVDRTEMRIYCLGPVGESAAARERRIRQYEDFFNSTGLATPDDTVCYQDIQAGMAARDIDWQQGYDRGMTARIEGPDSYADELGIRPATSVTGPFDTQDETVFHAGYREWLRLMGEGCSRDAQGRASSASSASSASGGQAGRGDTSSAGAGL